MNELIYKGFSIVGDQDSNPKYNIDDGWSENLWYHEDGSPCMTFTLHTTRLGKGYNTELKAGSLEDMKALVDEGAAKELEDQLLNRYRTMYESSIEESKESIREDLKKLERLK